MRTKEIIKQIKGVFKLPIKKYYFGKIKHGTPYFSPMNFNPHIISFRKLKLTDKDKYEEIIKKHPWEKERAKFTNLPMCRRSKDWILKLFNQYYWIQIGWPIKIHNGHLGWKDKFDTPRFEWSPSFQIYFFSWQFCIHWIAPIKDDDTYWEMVLWYLNYSNKNITKAEQTWGWTNYNTKESTWNKNCLITNVSNE